MKKTTYYVGDEFWATVSGGNIQIEPFDVICITNKEISSYKTTLNDIK